MQDLEKQYARVFQTRDGHAVLEHMRKITIERVLGANATDNELRWMEATRAFVRQIETMITRGKQG
ncbi:MAG: hypothetical protein KBT14_01645 [Proteobacteria bacterium]|nr:hypothetical protein [Candidatus Enterousia onthequi]